MMYYLEEMQANGLEPDLYTYSALFSGFARVKNVQGLSKYLEMMIANGIKPDGRILTAAMKGYGKAGYMDEMLWCFDLAKEEGIQPDIVMYNTILDVYVQREDLAQAEKYFREIIRDELKPTLFTFNRMLALCAKKRDTDSLKKYYFLMADYRHGPDMETLQSILMAYGNELSDVRRILSRFKNSIFMERIKPLTDVAIETQGDVAKILDYLIFFISKVINSVKYKHIWVLNCDPTGLHRQK
jgi:pentatricopeptide repeat protein